jgi:hypothetical protein
VFKINLLGGLFRDGGSEDGEEGVHYSGVGCKVVCEVTR